MTPQQIGTFWQFDIAKELNGMAFNPQSFDFYFRVEGHDFGVNRALASALSPVMRQLFQNDWNGLSVIEMPRTTQEGFRDFIQYFYDGTVVVRRNNIGPMLVFSKQYKVHNIHACAVEFLGELNTENIVLNFLLAKFHRLEELRLHCIRYISEHTEEILRHQMQPSRINFMPWLLEATEHRSCSEAVVFDICIQWAQAAIKDIAPDAPETADSPEAVRIMLRESIGFIRFNKLELKECVDIIRSKWWAIFTEEEQHEILLHHCMLIRDEFE